MGIIKALIAAALACVSMSSFATATFDGTNLNLSAVRVGSTTYTNVRLGVVNLATYTFRLTGVDPQTSTAPADITFDGATGVLTIPAVSVASATYSVTLQLTDAPTYTFALNLNSVTLLPPATSGNASACLDLNYLATGTRWQLSYHTLTSGTETSTYNSDILITGPQTFNNQSAIEVKSTTNIITGQAAGTTALAWSYVKVQNLDVFDLGTKVTGTTQGYTSDTVTTFDPPPFWRYSLNAGELVTTNWTATATTTITGFPIPPTTTTYSGSDRYTFLGYEDVTVPAGTFAGACKWRHTFTQTVGGQTATAFSTLWNTRKGGLVRTVSGNDVTELTAGTVNGGPVGP